MWPVFFLFLHEIFTWEKYKLFDHEIGLKLVLEKALFQPLHETNQISHKIVTL